MRTTEQKKLDREFRDFVKRHFKSPHECKNSDQIQFYVNELSEKIKETEETYNYVPDQAYVLLSQYNNLQNAFINADFRNA